jgi:hypothetical protein
MEEDALRAIAAAAGSIKCVPRAAAGALSACALHWHA